MVALAVLAPATAHAEPPRFADAGPLSSDTGHVALAWQADGPLTLSMGKEGEEPQPIYAGAGETLFLSGLADGTYTLHLADADGVEGAPVELVVTHQSLSRALMLAGLGALVFLLTVATIFRGSRDG